MIFSSEPKRFLDYRTEWYAKNIESPTLTASKSRHTPRGIVDELVSEGDLQVLSQHADEVGRVPQGGRNPLVINAVQVGRQLQASDGVLAQLLLVLDRVDGLKRET